MTSKVIIFQRPFALLRKPQLCDHNRISKLCPYASHQVWKHDNHAHSISSQLRPCQRACSSGYAWSDFQVLNTFLRYRLMFLRPAAPDISLTDYQFQAYVTATGATDHHDGNGYVLTPAQFANLKNFTITFGVCPKCTQTILIPDAQIRHRASTSDPIRLAITGVSSVHVD